MRVLQLIDSLSVGGAERMAVNLANAFSSEKIATSLISSREAGPLEAFLAEPENLYCLHKKSTFDLKAFGRLVKLATKFKPTHLHVHDSSVYWAVALKKMLPGTKLVWHIHYGGLFGEEKRFGDKIKFISSQIDFAIAVNQELASQLQEAYPTIKHVAYIENFPDLPKKINRNKVKREILCLANLKAPKNHHLLIRSFAKFLPHFPDYTLNLVGSNEEGSYLTSLRELISQLSLEDHVRFSGQILDLSKAFEAAEFAVLPSDSEGLPVSLLELGLAQVPIVCTSVGQCPELLGQGRYGLLTPAGDEEKLAESLIFMAENKAIAHEQAAHFFAHVSEKYGAVNFVKKYRTLLNQD